MRLGYSHRCTDETTVRLNCPETRWRTPCRAVGRTSTSLHDVGDAATPSTAASRRPAPRNLPFATLLGSKETYLSLHNRYVCLAPRPRVNFTPSPVKCKVAAADAYWWHWWTPHIALSMVAGQAMRLSLRAVVAMSSTNIGIYDLELLIFTRWYKLWPLEDL